MKHLLLLACLLLTACAPVVVTVPASGGGDVLPAEAQRVIDRATATAGAVATQAAQATAWRVQTQEAITDAQTLATLAAAQTQDVISQTAVAATSAAQATLAAAQTQTAGAAQAQATAVAATATVQMAGALATQTIKREEQRTLVQTAGGMASFMLKGLLFLTGLFGLYWVARWVGGAIDADLTRRRNAAAYRETPIGAVLLMADPHGGYNYRLIAPPASEPAVVENEPAATPEPARRTIERWVMGKQQEPLVVDWDRPEDEAVLAEIVALLREAIAVESNEATRIPRYSKLPTWSTNPEGWKRLTDRLMMAGHVTKVAGKNGGTFVTRGRTLYQLLAGLSDHSCSLAPVDVVAANVSQNIS